MEVFYAPSRLESLAEVLAQVPIRASRAAFAIHCKECWRR